MDTDTRSHTALSASPQAELPFEQLPPRPLPFHDEADAPIGFALTARARREVAPRSVPELTVVGDALEDDPSDTRPARARALRRAGVALRDIAQQLGVDELLVRAWAGDVAGDVSGRDAGSSVTRAQRAAVTLAATTRDAERRFEARRAEARTSGELRLHEDADFAAGVGLLAGLATADRHGVGFRSSRPELAARLIAWLVDVAGADVRDVRVVLRVGPRVAGDLTRHRWSAPLGIALEQIAATPWHHAPADEAIEALVRVADPEVGARVAGWCEALVQPDLGPADVAF